MQLQSKVLVIRDDEALRSASPDMILSKNQVIQIFMNCSNFGSRSFDLLYAVRNTLVSCTVLISNIRPNFSSSATVSGTYSKVIVFV